MGNHSEQKVFDVVVSLGGFCQVADQIERHFGFRINSPFDWLITPLEAIEKVLRDDGDSFCKEIKVINDGGSAACPIYGVTYHHEFRRDDDGRIIVSAEAIERSRSKLKYKYKKLVDALGSNRKTLFIRFGGHNDIQNGLPYAPDPRTVVTRDLNSLCEAIDHKFPGLAFEIAFVHIEEFTKLDVNIENLDTRLKIFRLEGDLGPNWKGRDQSWKPIFESFRFELQWHTSAAVQFGESPIESEILH